MKRYSISDLQHNIVGIVAMLVINTIWCLSLIGTSAYESTFVFVSVLSFALYTNELYKNKDHSGTNKTSFYILGAICSLSVVLADYHLFINGTLISIARGGASFICGFVVLSNLFIQLSKILDESTNANKHISREKVFERKSLLIVGIIAFCIPTAICVAYLYLCCYPGWLNTDTADQIGQMLSGVYRNHHPFWHTKLMEVFVKPFISLNKGNTGVVLFCLFQIICMSLVWAYIAITALQIGISKRIIYIVTVIHALMPYHIGMSCGLVKDSFFGIMIALLTSALFRLTVGIGDFRYLDSILLAIATIGSCLFRTNGMLAVAVMIVCAWTLISKKSYVRRVIIVMSVAFVFSLILNNAFLKIIDVPQPDVVESLSIPLQQIARTSYDKKAITDEQKRVIDNFVGYERLAEVYNKDCSDNVKNEIRNNGNQKYIMDNKLLFVKTWLAIGARYPFNYMKAWVDETYGYWCMSASYGCWGRGITDRVDFGGWGIYNSPKSQAAIDVWNIYESVFTENRIWGAEILLSVGMRFWLLVYMFVWCITKKNNTGATIIVLPIAIVITLLIATPVCNTFRYAYAVFTVYPVAIIALLYGKMIFQRE